MSASDSPQRASLRGWQWAAIAAVLVALLATVLTMTSRGQDGAGAVASGTTSTDVAVTGSEAEDPGAGEDTTNVETPTIATDELLPTAVAGLAASDPLADDLAIEAGAQEALVGTYAAGPVELEVKASEWVSEDAATDYAEAVRSEEADFGTLIDSGPVGVPARGTYWYYEKDGLSTIVWVQDGSVFQAQGEPLWVQDFFVQFPR